MNIKIYQIDSSRDENRVAFLSLTAYRIFQKRDEIDSRIYNQVYEGEVNCSTLEGVYMLFNLRRPGGFRGYPLSVSDVVEVCDGTEVPAGFYYCDRAGFHPISFDAARCEQPQTEKSEKQKQIQVLWIEPMKPPKRMWIAPTLSQVQELVGGEIEEYMPFEDEVAILCNEEGKSLGLPFNRAIYREPKKIEMTYQELGERFWKTEKERKGHLTGYIVFSQDSFQKPYSLESRTYRFSSDNKAFWSKFGSRSIYADSLDGTDQNVRIDRYMKDEMGGPDGWKIERCYLLDGKREIEDIIAGPFLICYAPLDSDKYDSLPERLIDKYQRQFQHPEIFFTDLNGKIKVKEVEEKEQSWER